MKGAKWMSAGMRCRKPEHDVSVYSKRGVSEVTQESRRKQMMSADHSDVERETRIVDGVIT